MSEHEAVRVQLLDPLRIAHFWTIELPKGSDLPRLHSRQSYQDRAFEVMGILSFGNGHGPVLLALPVQEAEEAHA